MLSSHYVKVPTIWALAAVVLILGTSVVVSLIFPAKEKQTNTQ